MRRLSEEDRQFFALVRQAVTANPFSDARAAIDLKISGRVAGASDAERLERTIAEVARRIDHMDHTDQAGRKGRGRGAFRIDEFEGKDRDLVESAVLFDTFHRYLGPFDRFILSQVRAGRKTLAVPFAGEALSRLEQRDFSPEAALRYFGLFFQLRRAFFFIDQSLVGRSEAMKHLRRQLWNNVFTDDIEIYQQYLWNRMENFSTLILGETGTGKGASAAAIGRSGYIPFDRATGCFTESFTGAFVALNLSRCSEALIESELFGHRKGAFTGAVEDHKGVFERCSPNGAIFLDEIGEVAKTVQIKLLQVIEERRFSPVGSHEERRFGGRVIAATNRTMKALRGNRRMRDDFYYRLCSDVIVVPPLRRRIAEDPMELEDLLAHMTARLLGTPAPEIVGMLKAGIDRQLGTGYGWPGNVRELEQCIRRLLLNRTYAGDSLPVENGPADRLKNGIDAGSLDARSLVSGYCRLLYQRTGTYEAVARITGLDRRTVKRHVDQAAEAPGRLA